MLRSSMSRGKQQGKRPASSSSALNERGKKRAAEEEEEIQELVVFTVKSKKKEVCFKVDRKTKLQKALKTFCERAGVKYSNMRFILAGIRFPLTATPDELGMNNGDEIQAMEWQSWGH